MVRLDDGRAVLWGFHTQHSQTAGADLLGGSPDWIGQPEVRQRLEADELGFVYGAFNGTWARASYPGDPWEPAEDGFAQIGEWITSDEAAADEMVEWVAEWAGPVASVRRRADPGCSRFRGVGRGTGGVLRPLRDRSTLAAAARSGGRGGGGGRLHPERCGTRKFPRRP